MNAIETAVLPLKVEAVKRAEQEARKMVANAARELEAAGFDLNIVAPHPNGSLPRDAYMGALAIYKFFGAITKWRQATYMRHEPKLADVDPERAERWIVEAKEDAAVQYDAFVEKLVGKIGACESAALTGNHVWSYSILAITKADGSRESWKTQMIVNRSKLGKFFNQFPTRQLKAAA